MRKRCATLPVLMGSIVLLTGCAQGEYRMPYENGAIVEVNHDHVTHSTPKAYMYDIEAQSPTPAAIVAAAPGWIRFIEDDNQESTQNNNYVWIEHPYPFCPVDASRANWPGKPATYNSTCLREQSSWHNQSPGRLSQLSSNASRASATKRPGLP